MHRDDRVNQVLADFFRGGGPEQREWTRDEIGALGFSIGGLYGGPSFRLAPASTTEALEYLAGVHYLRKSKRGSRAIYSRGPEEMTRRPDLPDGWLWEHVRNINGGFWVHILTGRYAAEGGPLGLFPLPHADEPKLVGLFLGHRRRVETDANRWGRFQHGQRALKEWDVETEQWIRKAAKLPRLGLGSFEAIPDPEGDPIYLFADIRDQEALLALRDLASDRNFAHYRARKG